MEQIAEHPLYTGWEQTTDSHLSNLEPNPHICRRTRSSNPSIDGPLNIVSNANENCFYSRLYMKVTISQENGIFKQIKTILQTIYIFLYVYYLNGKQISNFNISFISWFKINVPSIYKLLLQNSYFLNWQFINLAYKTYSKIKINFQIQCFFFISVRLFSSLPKDLL